MTAYRIETNMRGHWEPLGTLRDDLCRRDYGQPAQQVAQASADRLAAAYPDSEFRPVPCEVAR